MARTVEFEQPRARGLGVIRELFRAMRPKDWIKNVFVFAAIAFSEQKLWLNFPSSVAIVAMAFVLFCMVAGSIYLINDLVDIEKDRAHPKKRNRPLASGRLSPLVAKVAAVVFLGTAIPAAFALDAISVPWTVEQVPWQQVDFGLALVSYVLIQGIFYSYYLKHVVLLDVFTIAAGFVLRAVAGAMVLDIHITEWLLICMGLLSLFLGFAKRRAELVLLEGGAGEHRRILQEYSLPMLDQMLSIITGAIIIAYTFFTTNDNLPETESDFPLMLATAPIVTYALFRYLYLIYQKDGGGNPAEIVLGDRPFTISLLLWGLISLALLTFGS
ncbi:MAG: decaprenyl-phosphate phosphoribosyltransferase [Roseiflexaceae bacterium]|nr:decaprenyl-phosphate phosphoribosyltransferase [Roseiflexaceae bacterium]